MIKSLQLILILLIIVILIPGCRKSENPGDKNVAPQRIYSSDRKEYKNIKISPSILNSRFSSSKEHPSFLLIKIENKESKEKAFIVIKSDKWYEFAQQNIKDFPKDSNHIVYMCKNYNKTFALPPELFKKMIAYEANDSFKEDSDKGWKHIKNKYHLNDVKAHFPLPYKDDSKNRSYLRMLLEQNIDVYPAAKENYFSLIILTERSYEDSIIINRYLSSTKENDAYITVRIQNSETKERITIITTNNQWLRLLAKQGFKEDDFSTIYPDYMLIHHYQDFVVTPKEFQDLSKFKTGAYFKDINQQSKAFLFKTYLRPWAESDMKTIGYSTYSYKEYMSVGEKHKYAFNNKANAILQNGGTKRNSFLRTMIEAGFEVKVKNGKLTGPIIYPGETGDLK